MAVDKGKNDPLLEFICRELIIIMVYQQYRIMWYYAYNNNPLFYCLLSCITSLF